MRQSFSTFARRFALLGLVLAVLGVLRAPVAGVSAATGDTAAQPPLPGTSDGAGWQALPDIFNDVDSPRFLTVSGPRNFTLAGTDVAQNIIRLTFTPPIVGGVIDIRVFDADYSGQWDQRVDQDFVFEEPETFFEVFADPSNIGAAAMVASNRVALLTSSSVLTDRAWTELMSLDPASVDALKGRAVDGRFHFLVRTRLQPVIIPQIPEDKQGFENNGYKLAFNGTYVLPAGQVLGFTGGAIDAIAVIGTQASRDLGGFPTVPNNYFSDIVRNEVALPAGQFEFPFDPRSFCGDLKAFNADADWNATILPGATDNAPTGVPPDNGGSYFNPQFGEVVDNTTFKVGAAIQFQYVRPDATVEFDSSLAANGARFSPLNSGGASHPSITEGLQSALPGAGGDPFQAITLADAQLRATPGIWKLRWTGVDAHNSVFIKFDRDFGTTPQTPKLTGRLFCDANGNQLFDGTEQPLALVPLVLTPVGGGAALNGSTLVDGTFSFDAVNGTLYDLTLGANANLCPTTVALPKRVGPVFCDPVLIPFTCTYRASGHVFCDANRDGIWNPALGDTVLTCNPTIRLSFQGSAEFVEVVSTAGTWSTSGLKPGTWNAFVKAGSCADTLTKTSLAIQPFTLNNTTCSKDNIDFGYVCEETTVCFKAFCDYDDNCQFTAGDDLLAVSVTIRKLPGGVPTFTATTLTDGQFRCFGPVEPGTWEVVVGSVPNATLKNPITQIVVDNQDLQVLLCYECLGAIHGKVLKENCTTVCDGAENGNEVPIAGVKVELLGGPTVRPPQTTGPAGTYSFLDLVPGNYTVRVNLLDGQNVPVLINLTANSDMEVPTVVQRGDDIPVDFFFCECVKGRIHGYVFKNPVCESCDSQYVPGEDEPVPGVLVVLTGIVNGVPFSDTTTTGADGHYEFGDLFAGTYTVSIDDPVNQDVVLVLTPAGDITVPGIVLPSGGEARQDFGFCRQRACAFVYREPPCECDGIYEPLAGDVPVEGVTVVLTLTGGEHAGATYTQSTGDDGRTCFENLPLGSFEITVPDQPALAGLTRSTDATLTWHGDGCATEFEFGWCTPGEEETRLCAKVFCEPKGECDGVFDEGRDKWMQWIEVFVGVAGDNDGYLTSGFTDADGRVCFEGLPPGEYVIYVGSNQDKLKGYKPSTPNCYRVVLGECDKACAPFGYCETCVPTPCCEGDLHEVTVGTAIWVGRRADAFELKAKLLDGCGCGCGIEEIDGVSLKWRRHLPSDLVGPNEVLRIVDVKVKDGVAYVVIKLTATGHWFRDGVFGNRPLQLDVTLNGTTYRSCAKYRCESFRPGLLFTWGECCPPMPPCEGGWRWDGNSCWDAPWLTCGFKCGARFLVLDTKSRDTVECGACERCPTSCSDCPRCTELLPDHAAAAR